MTRSDIILEMSHLNKMTGEEKTLFILKLHHKIESVYEILFAMEKKFEELKPINELLRKALESN